MTTTGDGKLSSAADGDCVRCLFCRLVVDAIEGPESPGWPEFDRWTVCDDCSEKLDKENAAFGLDRLLSMLPSLEREVFMLRYGLNDDRQYYSLDEIADRLGIARQRVTEIEEQAFEKLRASAQE
jgi:DNA-directed RNA polymerase specialized sigma24 family protein